MRYRMDARCYVLGSGRARHSVIKKTECKQDSAIKKTECKQDDTVQSRHSAIKNETDINKGIERMDARCYVLGGGRARYSATTVQQRTKCYGTSTATTERPLQQLQNHYNNATTTTTTERPLQQHH